MQVLEHSGQYSLVNDGSLELFFLGVGTAFAKESGHTNFLIVKGEDHVLVDFGTLGPQRLESVAGLDPLDIHCFLPTHSHADHVGGMEYLTIHHRYRATERTNHPGLKVIASEDFGRALWRMSLRGGLGFNEPGMDGRDELFEVYYDVIRPNEISGSDRQRWHVTIGSLEIEMFRTHHAQGMASPEGLEFYSHGMLIDNRIFFSGDSVFDPLLIDFYRDRAEYWIHDANIGRTPLHSSLDELRTLPEEIRKDMLLVHYPERAAELSIPDFAGWCLSGHRYIFS